MNKVLKHVGDLLHTTQILFTWGLYTTEQLIQSIFSVCGMRMS